MTTKLKIKKIERIRLNALQQRRELHQRRNDPFFAKEYSDLGAVIDQANAAIYDLDVILEIENI
jgi:hypothetical protein